MENDRIEYQNTKIVATLGPASSSREMMKQLIEMGVDVFRLNFSHGSHDSHAKAIEQIHELNLETGRHVGILADLQGPKLRVGEIEGDGIDLNPGDELYFINKEVVGNKEEIYMSYENFPTDVTKGEKVLIDDGKIFF